MTKAWNVYILKSLIGQKLYIGCTNNLNRRIREHNAGHNTSTRLRAPFELIYTETYTDQTAAYQREKLLKRYKGGNALRKLIDR
jgi:putative endonuclease